MSLKYIAVFGANGQLGQSIIAALLGWKKQTFNVLAVIPPKTPEPSVPDSKQDYRCSDISLFNASQGQLKIELKGIDAVLSALNGKAFESQPLIPDGAADAGVKLFYPSEYGFHQTYRKPSADWVSYTQCGR